LIQYRLKVEVLYFLELHKTNLPPLQALSEQDETQLLNWLGQVGPQEAAEVKKIERITNHDVKAVEYRLKQALADLPVSETVKANEEFVHFGLTSQDINNTATPMMIRDALQLVYIPKLETVIAQLKQYAELWWQEPMLARTHGQPASPTMLGKEFQVFVSRLERQTGLLKAMKLPAKFGGASGNLNAHYVAYPDHDWQGFATHFVEEILGLSRSVPTTQIEHYDGLGEIFDCLKRINTILIDFCQDVWIYVSQEYFKQKVIAGEVGSSAMPHKVNPIDFENAEGNCGISTALLEFLSRKLPVSRLQRDLTDSTVLRNVGVALGHGYLSLLSLLKGLRKLQLNDSALKADLDANWAVLAEAIQTILRRERYPKPYEALKALTRGKARITQLDFSSFIEKLQVSDSVKEELRYLRPEWYTGKV
ncbi:MAG: adenylosuccinate lyase, partial [Bacteroidota bacterium]